MAEPRRVTLVQHGKALDERRRKEDIQGTVLVRLAAPRELSPLGGILPPDFKREAALGRV